MSRLRATREPQSVARGESKFGERGFSDFYVFVSIQVVDEFSHRGRYAVEPLCIEMAEPVVCCSQSKPTGQYGVVVVLEGRGLEIRTSLLRSLDRIPGQQSLID